MSSHDSMNWMQFYAVRHPIAVMFYCYLNRRKSHKNTFYSDAMHTDASIHWSQFIQSNARIWDRFYHKVPINSVNPNLFGKQSTFFLFINMQLIAEQIKIRKVSTETQVSPLWAYSLYRPVISVPDPLGTCYIKNLFICTLGGFF